MRMFFGPCAAALLVAAPASAQTNVNVNANILSGCTLTLGTSGTMALDSSGTVMTSQPSSGATISLVASGSNPTVTFGAPTLPTSPAGWGATPTLSVAYTSTGGANQAFTSAQSSYSETRLIDSFTVHGKVESSSGFAAGNYQLRTVVTCS